MAGYAFVGAGRMASAMVRGLLCGGVAPERIACLGGAGGSAARLATETGVRLAAGPADLLADAAVVVVACKPQVLPRLDPALGEQARGLLISVLAGTTIARLRAAFPGVETIVRTMPNTPGQIGAGITPWAPEHPLPPAALAEVRRLLGALGEELELPEGQLDAAMAISGCGPGYVFEWAAALRDAGVEGGLDPAVADRLTRAMLRGAALLLAQAAERPEALRDAVTSPGGTTLAALEAFRAAGWAATTARALAAARDRAAVLARA